MVFMEAFAVVKGRPASEIVTVDMEIRSIQRL